MKTPLFWAIVVAIAVWQVELAVHSGIAASKRPKPQPSKSATPVCTGTSCPPSPQPQYQRVIVTPR